MNISKVDLKARLHRQDRPEVKRPDVKDEAVVAKEVEPMLAHLLKMSLTARNNILGRMLDELSRGDCIQLFREAGLLIPGWFSEDRFLRVAADPDQPEILAAVATFGPSRALLMRYFPEVVK